MRTCTFGPYSDFELLFQFLVGDLQLVGRQTLQCQRGPDDVPPILFRRDVAFLLQHLQPAVFGQIESARNPRDLFFNVLVREPHVLLATRLEDQLLVDQAFQDRFAITLQALLGQLLARDGLTVDDRHDGRLWFRRARSTPWRAAAAGDPVRWTPHAERTAGLDCA